MRKLLLSALLATASALFLGSDAFACIGCSRLDNLESSMTLVMDGGRGSISGYDEGVFQGPVSTLNVVGAGATLAVAGKLGTLTIAGSVGGGGDNFGTAVATRVVDMNGFAIIRATGIAVGTGTPSAIVHISTNNGYPGLILLVSTGSQKLFEVTGTSITAFVTMRVSSIAAAAVDPLALNATAAPTDTQVASFDSASGKFKWVTAGSSGGDETSKIRRAHMVTISTSADFLADFVGTDQTPYNAAIASVAVNGGSIRVLKGDYTFTGEVSTIPWNCGIYFDQGVRLITNGNVQIFKSSGIWDGGTVTTASSYAQTFLILFSSSVTRDLKFRACSFGTAIGIQAKAQSTNITMEGIQFLDNLTAAAWYGVRLSNVTNVRIRNFFNYNNNNTNNIEWRIENSTGIIITGGQHVDFAADIAVALDSVFDVNVTNNIFESRTTSTDGVFYFLNVSSNVSFTNNTLIGTTAGTSEGISVRDCTSLSNLYVGNNYFKGFGEAAVNLAACAKQAYLSGNITVNGVFVADSGANTTFRDNRLANNTFQADTP